MIPSYALKDRSLPTKPTRAQIELAVKGWEKFPRAKLIMSTGDNQWLGIPNSKVMVEYALRLGVPRENLIEEDRSLNTFENLLYSMDIVQADHLQQPTLVTLDLYTRRAVATAKKTGLERFLLAFGVLRGRTGFRIQMAADALSLHHLLLRASGHAL